MRVDVSTKIDSTDLLHRGVDVANVAEPETLTLSVSWLCVTRPIGSARGLDNAENVSFIMLPAILYAHILRIICPRLRVRNTFTTWAACKPEDKLGIQKLACIHKANAHPHLVGRDGSRCVGGAVIGHRRWSTQDFPLCIDRLLVLGVDHHGTVIQIWTVVLRAHHAPTMLVASVPHSKLDGGFSDAYTSPL